MRAVFVQRAASSRQGLPVNGRARAVRRCGERAHHSGLDRSDGLQMATLGGFVAQKSRRDAGATVFARSNGPAGRSAPIDPPDVEVGGHDPRPRRSAVAARTGERPCMMVRLMSIRISIDAPVRITAEECRSTNNDKEMICARRGLGSALPSAAQSDASSVPEPAIGRQRLDAASKFGRRKAFAHRSELASP